MQVHEVIKSTTPQQQRVNQLKQQLDTAKRTAKITKLNQQQQLCLLKLKQLIAFKNFLEHLKTGLKH